jgi:hypothetical protein
MVENHLARHQVYPSFNAAATAEIPSTNVQMIQVGLNQVFPFVLGVVYAVAGTGWLSASRAASRAASGIGTKVV